MAAENVLATQMTLGMIGAGVLQYLKNAKFVPFIDQHSQAINHFVLLLTSAAGALGVHTAWSAGTHTLTITGLSAAGIASAVWVWAKQWTVQYLVHQGAFGSVSVAALPTAPPPKP
jgi:hypothetical protein